MKNDLLVCPWCGAQYTPMEIFYPNYVFLTDRAKWCDEAKSKIDGKFPPSFKHQLDTEEVYNCDFCGKDFTATMEVVFRSKKKLKTKPAMYYKKNQLKLDKPLKVELGENSFGNN